MPLIAAVSSYNGKAVSLFRTLREGETPEAQCISHCNCFTSSISPVCGSNGVTYLSACFAGCTQTGRARTTTSISQVFTLERFVKLANLASQFAPQEKLPIELQIMQTLSSNLLKCSVTLILKFQVKEFHNIMLLSSVISCWASLAVVTLRLDANCRFCLLHSNLMGRGFLSAQRH